MKRKTQRKTPQNTDNKVWLRQLTRRALHRQGGCCYHCKKSIAITEATGDHYPIARYQGGMTRPDNIVASCSKCNNERNTETNRHNGRLDTTVGDTTHRSPFEILSQLKLASNGT